MYIYIEREQNYTFPYIGFSIGNDISIILPLLFIVPSWALAIGDLLEWKWHALQNSFIEMHIHMGIIP